MIKLSGAKEVAELFRLVPGYQVTHFRGNNPVVSYQGLSGEYPQGVQVLIDGRSVYNPIFGGVDWSNLPLNIENIERIEVIRGPNSSSFGSNAFQSVINISTTHSAQFSGLQVKSTTGERGFQRTLLKAGVHQGDLDIQITGSHIDDNGYAHNFDDTRHDSLTGRIDYSLTSIDTLQVNFGAVNSLRETVNPSDFNDPTDPLRTKDDSQFSLHGKWERTPSSQESFITQLSYISNKSKDHFNSSFIDATYGPLIYSGNQTSFYDRWDFEFEHQLQPNDSLRLAWGIGLRSDRVSYPYWLNDDKKFDNSLQRFFGNAEWRIAPSLVLNIGSLLEHSQLVGDNFSPRLAANYLFSPTQSIRFITSRAFRTPSLSEQNFDFGVSFTAIPGELYIPVFQSEGDLEPEVVTSFEFGYHGIFLNNKLTLDVKLFRNEYEDLLSDVERDVIGGITLNDSPIATTEVRFFENLYYVDVNGYEIEVNYRPSKQSLIHAGYAYNHAKSNEGKFRSHDALVESVPVDSFNFLAAHTFENKTWVSAAFYYTSSMEFLISGNSLGPMRRLDINTGKTFGIAPNQNLDITLSLQLALDKNKDFLTEFTVDNRAFIEASYTFE
jgi:iron complex outermembrane receptor protein